MKFWCKDLQIGYNKNSLVQNINFETNSGDFIVLLGKNGSGKSTLLKTLSGIIKKQSGAIFIDNKNTNEFSGKNLSQIISIVLTDRIEIPFTVQEILQLGRQAYTNVFDRLQEKDVAVINSVVKLLNINNLLHKNIQEISDGERQKVMIARALIQETPIILLDEPTTHLDLENKTTLLKLLKEISIKQNKIIILSTHEINLILPIVEKIWIINQNTFEEINNPQKNHQKISNLFHGDSVYFDTDCQFFKIKLSE